MYACTFSKMTEVLATFVILSLLNLCLPFNLTSLCYSYLLSYTLLCTAPCCTERFCTALAITHFLLQIFHQYFLIVGHFFTINFLEFSH